MTNPKKHAEAGHALPAQEDAEKDRYVAVSQEDIPVASIVPDTSANSRKRSVQHTQIDDSGDETQLEESGEEEDRAKKRRLSSGKKSIPPPKKLNNELWDQMFQRLVEYKEKHGDCLVPKRYSEDPKLGTWVETQRVQWKRLPRTQAKDGEVVTPNKRLNDERLRRLESVGFVWSAKYIRKPKPASPTNMPAPKARKTASATDASARAEARQRSNDATWNEMFNRLVEYKAKHGDCLVPKKYNEDPKLASWVETQRNLNNRDYKAKLSVDQAFDEVATEAASIHPPFEGKTPEEWAAEMANVASSSTPSEIEALLAAAAVDVDHQVAVASMEVDSEVNAIPTEGSKPAAEEAADATGMPTDGKRLSQERRDKLDALGFVWSLRSKRVDDHWDDMYQQLVEYKEKHGDCLVPSRYDLNFKLGKWVETQRYEYTKMQRNAEHKGNLKEEEPDPGTNLPSNPRLTEERRHKLEAIGFEWKVKHKMKRYYDRQWDFMFKKLLKFKEETGSCLVPKRYPPDIKLGTWVHTQRIQYRKYAAVASGTTEEQREDAEDDGSGKGDEDQHFRLTEDRRQRLDAVGFVWSARDIEKPNEPARIARNSYDDQWDAMFARLVAYKEQRGDCLVPKRCKDDPKLGTWVDTQRVQRKKMLKQLATQEVKAECSKTVEKDEDASVSSGTAAASEKKPGVGRLTDERISRLEGIGFVWSLRDDWQKHYDELKEYKKEHGDCNVPARYAKNRRLGIWVSAQRQQKKIIDAADKSQPRRLKAPLTKERVDLLNELDFTWTIRSRDSFGESWNQRFEELKAYKKEHGNCLVPSRFPPNPELGVWVGTQRTQYRLYVKAKEAGKEALMKSAMNEDRVAELEEMGFVWALRGGSDSAWRKKISELVEYSTVNGDTAVPASYTPNKLGSWAAQQRVQYRLMQEGKATTLDEEKVAELDSLHFSWEEPQGQAEAVTGTVQDGFAVAISESKIKLAVDDQIPDSIEI